MYVIEQELGRLGKDGVLAYFSCDLGSRLSNKQVYILQLWDEKWGTYIDVSDMDQVKTWRSPCLHFATTTGQCLFFT